MAGSRCVRSDWLAVGRGPRRPRPLRPAITGAPAINGPELGEGLRLGLESLPRRARSGRPNWSGRLRALGSRADVGAAATTSTAVGAGGAGDVEPDCEWVGILEQPDLDSDLIERRLARSRRDLRAATNLHGCAARNVSFGKPAVS